MTSSDRVLEIDAAPAQKPYPLWILAIAVAAIGTWILFDAEPGINWLIWTAAAVAGLMMFLRGSQTSTRPVKLLGASAVILAGGAAVTADPFLAALICLSVMLLMALAMLLSVDPRLERLTATFTILSPAIAFGLALAEAVKRATDLLHLVRSPRTRAIVRGVAITLPIIVIFGLLLSSADPTFAEWREAIHDLLASWAFLPRTIFFTALLALVVGAYGFADRGQNEDVRSIVIPQTGLSQTRWLGSTERLILMAGVSLLFWTFLAIQLSYFFGNLPSVRGSGMTFAEYARRGFGELTVVASFTVLLIILAERYGQIDERRATLRVVTLSVVVAVLFFLGSASHRVWLYEEAYGFTTARLYAQAYMLVVAASITVLVREIGTEIDPARLFRRVGAVAVAAFMILIYWNHQAWIADRNIDLYSTTGKLDVVYLTRDLSADAIPEIVTRLPALPEPVKTQLASALKARHQMKNDDSWFEWNSRRARARQALGSL